jgi:Ca-activated chloride channel family protein
MRNTTRLTLLTGALALIFFATSANSQTPSGSQAPSPTPSQQKAAPLAPRPSPTPVETDAADEEGEVIRVSSNLVVVPVSVTDEKGQPVMGLTARDFRLEEEGRVQEIAQIGDPEQVPLEIALLLDVSGSVDARFSFEQQAASRFLKQVLKSADRATVFAIDITPRLEQTRATAEVASAKLTSIGPAKGPTAFYDTVVDAARYLAQSTPPDHRRVIVVISDGEDNYSEKVKAAIGATRQEQDAVTPKDKLQVYNRVLQEVLREVQRAEVSFYSINPSGEALKLNVISLRAQGGMEQLAVATGGTSFVPERLEDLDAVFRQIAAELRSQYLLQYYSTDESTNGKFLRIKASVPARPQLRVRARQGYYAKRK